MKCIPIYCVAFSLSIHTVPTFDSEQLLRFHAEVKNNSIEEVQDILSEYPDAAHITNNDQDTALHVAARCARAPMIALLLDTGKAVLEARNGRNETPLFNAVKHGNYDGAVMLVERGASVNISAGRFMHWKPLYYAVMLGYVKIVEMLLLAGASRDIVNARGEQVLRPERICLWSDSIRPMKILLSDFQGPELHQQRE